MTTESKLYTGVLASVVTGILLMFHVGDASQANTIAGEVADVVGGLITVGSAFIALDGLLFKHKAEVSSQHLLDTPNAPTVTPQAPVEPPVAPNP